MKTKQKYQEFLKAVDYATQNFWLDNNRFPVMVEISLVMYSDFRNCFTEKDYGAFAIELEKYGYFIVVPNAGLPPDAFNLVFSERHYVSSYKDLP